MRTIARLEARYLRLAQRDFDRARQLYEPIEGFSNVSVALRQVDDDDRARQDMADALAKKPKPVKRPALCQQSRYATPEGALAVTKSWESNVLFHGRQRRGGGREALAGASLSWLALSSVLVAAGLLMVYSAKTQNFPELSAALARGELLDLNQVSKPEQLLPFLQVFQDEAQREQVANKMFDYLATHRPIFRMWGLWRGCIWRVPLAKLKPALVVRTPA